MVELSFDLGKKKEVPQVTSSMSQVRDLDARIRSLEDVLTNIRKKIQITDANLITRSKQLETEIKLTSDDMKEIRREMLELKDRLSSILKELRLRATSDEVKVLQRYIDMWDPMKFVTKSDVDEIVEERVRGILGKTK